MSQNRISGQQRGRRSRDATTTAAAAATPATAPRRHLDQDRKLFQMTISPLDFLSGSLSFSIRSGSFSFRIRRRLRRRPLRDKLDRRRHFRSYGGADVMRGDARKRGRAFEGEAETEAEGGSGGEGSGGRNRHANVRWE